MPATAQPLHEIIAEQVNVLADIDAILSTEEEALQTRDPELLLAAAERKSIVLARLKSLENQRQSLSSELSAQHSNALEVSIAKCKAHNAKNASLLAAQQSHVTRLLSLLRGGEPVATYGTDGQAANDRQRRMSRGSA